MDFFETIFFLVWFGLLLKAIYGIFSRRRGRNLPTDEDETREEEPQQEEPRTELPPEPTEVPKRYTTTEEPQGGYDYKALRKRILDSWQQKEENAETDLPDEMEKPVYTEPVRIEPPAPRPEPVKPRVKPVAVSASIRADEERAKRLAAYASRPRKQVKAEVSMAAPPRPSQKRELLSAADARRWVAYDAVFGRPRALSPWRPR